MIIGASSLAQLEENLKICQAGPLEEGLVKLVDGLWEKIKDVAPPASA